jgi:hypothetical protein
LFTIIPKGGPPRAAPSESKDPTHELSCSLILKGLLSFCSNGIAGDVHVKSVPAENTRKFAVKVATICGSLSAFAASGLSGLRVSIGVLSCNVFRSDISVSMVAGLVSRSTVDLLMLCCNNKKDVTWY